MTDKHRAAFEQAKAEAQSAYQRIEQHNDATPGSLGPFGDQMRRTDEARLVDAYKRLLSLQFIYKDAQDVSTEVALAESRLADAEIPFEHERDSWSQQLQQQYMERRQAAEQVRSNVLAWRETIFGGRFDKDAYLNQLAMLESLAHEALLMYPEDQTFKGMKDQAIALRSEVDG